MKKVTNSLFILLFLVAGFPFIAAGFLVALIKEGFEIGSETYFDTARWMEKK